MFIGNHVAVFRMVSQIELEAIKAELVAPLGPVATASPALAVACDRLRRLAASDGELLIVGETGVGKEVYARAVHEASGRKGRFVAINCAAIPRELVESELFGYRAGAHSTAHQAEGGPDRGGRGRDAVPRRDRRDDARGADQDAAVPAGPRADAAGVDAAAAHRRADHRRHQPHRGRPGQGPSGLRDDIVARLGAAPIRLPPLRNRIEDLGALVGALPAARRPGRRASSSRRSARWRCTRWPLNVRELEKITTTAAVLTGGQADLAARSARTHRARAVAPGRAAGARRSTGPSPTPAQLEELLRRYEGNVADVSRELGKHRAAVWRWIKKFGLGPQKFRRME